MKKSLSVMLLGLLLGATFITPAIAGWRGRGPEGGRGAGYGPGSCGGPCAGRNLDNDLDQVRQDFKGQTLELRQQLHDKKGAYRELMRQESPNKEEAAKLWSEIFDLQGKIRKMGADAGFRQGRGWRQNDEAPPCGTAGCRNASRGCDGPGCGEGPRRGCGRGCDGPDRDW